MHEFFPSLLPYNLNSIPVTQNKIKPKYNPDTIKSPCTLHHRQTLSGHQRTHRRVTPPPYKPPRLTKTQNLPLIKIEPVRSTESLKPHQKIPTRNASDQLQRPPLRPWFPDPSHYPLPESYQARCSRDDAVIDLKYHSKTRFKSNPYQNQSPK
jgi:hypothetical protein